jgi:hypothetical protein
MKNMMKWKAIIIIQVENLNFFLLWEVLIVLCHVIVETIDIFVFYFVCLGLG